MTIEEQSPKVAAVCDITVGTNELQQLQKLVETLSEQAALLNAVNSKQTKGLPSEKLSRSFCKGRQSLLIAMVSPECIVVAAVKSEAAAITGYVGGVATTMMLDSGSSVSLFQKD